jgi:hypothetical protein
MSRASRPTAQLPWEHRSFLVEELSSVSHALACLAGIHSWIPMDAELYGETSGCVRCGDLRVGPPGPLDTGSTLPKSSRTNLTA